MTGPGAAPSVAAGSRTGCSGGSKQDFGKPAAARRAKRPIAGATPTRKETDHARTDGTGPGERDWRRWPATWPRRTVRRRTAPGDPIEIIIAMLQKGQVGPAIELLQQLQGGMSGAARPGGVDGTVAGM